MFEHRIIPNQGAGACAEFRFEALTELRTTDKREVAEFSPLHPGDKGGGGFVPFGAGTPTPDKEAKEDPDILNKAQEKIALLERDAYEKGFAQGKKDGFELGRKRAQKAVDRIEGLLNQLARLKEDILRRYEKEILELIFEISKKITYLHAESDNRVLRGTILNALQLAVEKSEVILKINPEEMDYVEQLRPELFSKFQGLKSIIVTPDPAIGRGGCYLETPYGAVDAGIDTRLEKIRECLEETFMRGKDVPGRN